LKGLAESGLMEYWIKRTLPKLDQCELDNYKKAAEEKRFLSFKVSISSCWDGRIILGFLDREDSV